MLQKAEDLLQKENNFGSDSRNRFQKPIKMPPFLERLLDREWKVSKLLHEISGKLRAPKDGETEDPGCLILIYTFPTEEIRQDTRKALYSLEEHFVAHLEFHERPKMVVFVDPESEALLDTDVRPFSTLEVVPAIIPQKELMREMNSYSCQDGTDCIAGEEMPGDFHRGNVNRTQFWSPAYLRISRYTAGPLFQHPQLDSCSRFLKIDTDFFFTSAIDGNPLKKMQDEGGRLGWWQMHVQGQRQTGYIDASLSFLKAGEFRARSKT